MEVKNQWRLGLVFSMLSGSAWGTFGVFTTLCLAAGVTDYAVVALSPAAMLIYFALRVSLKPQVLRGIPTLIVIGMFLQGGLLNNFMNYAYTQSFAANMPVAVVSTVAFCHVFVVMGLAYFLFKQKITVQKALIALAAIVGVSFVLGLFTSSEGTITFIGVVWTLVITVTLGLNIICNTFWLSRGVDSDAFLFILSIGSLVVMFTTFVNPVAFFTNLAAVMSSGEASNLVAVLGFMLIPNIFCYAVMMEGLKRIDPTSYTICYSLDPLTATILGFIVFTQLITGSQIMGIVIIIMAVSYLSIIQKREAETGV